jgi:hypothetical protein
MVMRRLFVHRREEVTGGWGELIIRLIKSRRIRLFSHVAYMGEVRSTCKIAVRKSEI